MTLRTFAPIPILALSLVGWTLPVDLDSLRAEAALVTLTEIAQVEAPEPPATLDAASVETIVANVQARYDTITDFQASFTQEVQSVTSGTPSVGSGEVYFLRPGHMLWDYADGRRLILDGASLHMIDSNERQFYSSPIGDSELPTAMRFLLGQGSLADDFEITLLPESDESQAMLDLVPRTPSGEYSRLLFVVDRATWNIVETTIVGVIGDTNTIRFSDISTNAGMTEASFAFSAPAGYTEITVPR